MYQNVNRYGKKSMMYIYNNKVDYIDMTSAIVHHANTYNFSLSLLGIHLLV